MSKIVVHKFLVSFLMGVFIAFFGICVPAGDSYAQASLSPRTLKKKVDKSFDLAVVPNIFSRDVSIINTKTKQEVKRIPLPVSDYPPKFKVAMSGNGKYAYISTGSGVLTGGVRIYLINLNTLTLDSSKTIDIPDFPTDEMGIGDLEISPDDKILIAGKITKGAIFFIDTQTNTIVNQVELGSNSSIAFSPDSKYAFIDNPLMNLIHVFDLETFQQVNTFQAYIPSGTSFANQVNLTVGLDLNGNNPALYSITGGFCFDGLCSVRKIDYLNNLVEDIAQQPGGSGTGIGYIELVTLSNGYIAVGNSWAGLSDQDVVTVINTQLNEIINIPSSEYARYLTYDPKRNELWSTCRIGGLPGANCGSGLIDVFDLTSNIKIDTISTSTTLGGHNPMSQDGKYYFFTDRFNDRIGYIDVNTHEVNHINLGDNPLGVFMQGDNGIKNNY
jgi:WD40 repeat protein